jgi:hypothetical protein
VNVASVVQDLFPETVDASSPMLNLLQGFFDESDPVNYGRRYFVEVPSGGAAKNVYVSLGLGDSYAPDPTIETFALAAGVQPVSPQLLPVPGLALVGQSFAAAPVSNNVSQGSRTGVLCEYDPGPPDASDDNDGHFVVFEVPAAIAQSTRFLATAAATGTATLVPPN